MKRGGRNRYSVKVALVLHVFMVLLASSLVSGAVYVILARAGVINVWNVRLFPLPIIGLMLSSVAIATSLTALSRGGPFRPFRKLTEATEEIAAGNFDVRVEVEGPQEIRQLAQSFNKMAAELGSIETLRSDFVGNVSHEFKTPVVSIRGFAKLLRRENLSEERRREYLDIIIHESERLSQLSGNMLLLSKLEKQESLGDVVEFPLDEQIRRCILLLEPQWSKKAIDMEISLPRQMYIGNEELLEQVWLNLIGNAIKFTGNQGIVTVSLKQEERSVVVLISDTGIGMDAETRDHLFDKFYQGDKSHAVEGNGLGLSLVKRIVELSGGAVTVQSALEEGSTFIVRLPA